MHSKNAFTLLEICLAITIGVLIFTFAVPSIEGFFAQQKLNKSFDTFDEIVAEAHKLSVLERRSYLLSWEKQGVVLRPEFPLNENETAGVAMVETRENESYDIELTAALVEKPPKEWVFWPSGNCEPARITYQGREGNWIARYDPLTARAAEVEVKLASIRRSRRSFVLLEAILGVLIFTIGILALGASVNNCLNAGLAKDEDQNARLALMNRMAEIEAGSIFVDNPTEEKLSGMFEGITLKQSRAPLKLKNEKDQQLTGLFNITIEAQWVSGRQPQSKSVSFYVNSAR